MQALDKPQETTCKGDEGGPAIFTMPTDEGPRDFLGGIATDLPKYDFISGYKEFCGGVVSKKLDQKCLLPFYQKQ